MALKEAWDNSSIGQFASKVSSSVSAYYEKHKTTINIIVGVAVIALCAVATVATAGTCGLALAMACGALKGAIIGAAVGAAEGGFKGALSYMEEHDTLDGAGSRRIEEGASGLSKGEILGAASGAMAGAAKYAKNPSGYCFVSGTLVLTLAGLIAIENVRPRDIVYAKEAVGIEQSVDIQEEDTLNSVLEIYEREVYETYILTIDGEEIETTANHPFYTDDGEAIEAKDLQEGDELSTSNGNSATVEKTEKVIHGEPIKVYNFAVMDSHTYYVGDTGVLVHNSCKAAVSNAAGKPSKAEILKQNRIAGKAAEKIAEQQLTDEGYKIIGSQVSVNTSAGRRVIDHLVLDPNGNIVAVEVKSGNAARSTSQLVKDALLESEGGKFVGKNAGKLKGQTLQISTIERRIELER